MEEHKYEIIRACTAVPVGKGTVLPVCGTSTPSRITCKPIIPGTYPWYILKPEIRRNEHRVRRRQKEAKENKKKCKLTKKNKHALRERRPSPEGTRLLFADTIGVLCPAGGPTEGRHKNTRQNDKRRDKEITQNGQSTNGQLVGQGYYCLSMKPGSMSRMLRCALQIFFIFSIMSLDSMSPPFSSARYARQ